MAFGNEDLRELRTQLVEAGPGSRSSLGKLSQARGASSAEERSLAAPASTSEAVRSPEPRKLTSEQERDHFLHMLGHELRNPLAPVQQAVELLLEHASEQDPADLRQARAVIARQVEHLASLVDVLLDVDHRTLSAASGTGGAEALIRRVAELHGGRVSSHGAAGHDTELRVWLPAAVPSELPAGAAAPVSRALRSRRILVVDDNEDAAEMLALVLRKRGYAVVLAFDGEEALAMAEKHHPEVVLLDIGLPGIDGYEVARRLRAKVTSERLTVVAVTGYGQPADRQRSREAGFDHHLVKPVAMERLLPLLEPEQPQQ
jgi:two-component system CheB/CheR fusion protein